MLIYLFRDEGTDNRALTMDVTGRNLPLVTSSNSLAVRGGDRHTEASATLGQRVFAIRGAPDEDDRLLSLRVRMGTTYSNATLLSPAFPYAPWISPLKSLTGVTRSRSRTSASWSPPSAVAFGADEPVPVNLVL
jgi:hypothetical protein